MDLGSVFEVSVVLAVYNPDQRLFDCIDSINQQTFEVKEIVLVDDGSTLDSKQIIEAAVERSSTPVKRIKNRVNLGLTRSLVKGVQHADGNIIARIDFDDRWALSHIEQSLFILHQQNADLVGSLCATEGNEVDLSTRQNCVPRFSSVKSIGVFNPIGHSSAVFRKSTYNVAGGYNISFPQAQDLKLWIDFLKVGGRLIKLHSPTVLRGINSNSISEKMRNQQLIFALRASISHRNFLTLPYVQILGKVSIHLLGSIRRKILSRKVVG